MKRNAALFLMKARNEGRLTQSTLQAVTRGTGDLCQQVIDAMKDKVSSIVNADCEMSDDKKREISAQVRDIDFKLFDGLEGEYLQEKYYAEEFGYMVSC